MTYTGLGHIYSKLIDSSKLALLCYLLKTDQLIVVINIYETLALLIGQECFSYLSSVFIPIIDNGVS